MLSRAVLRHLRITPRKVNFVVRPIRKRTVRDALLTLQNLNKRAARPVAKVVASAFANAKQNDPALSEDNVIISKLMVNEGPSWKRFRSAAFGRAVAVLKRTSHLTVELDRKS